MKKSKTDLSLILPNKIVDPKGALIEHQNFYDSGILDPNRLLKAIMYDYDWEKVFPGIRTTMSQWEYCVLRYFADELNGANLSNVLHNLSGNMRGSPESRIYRHTTTRYTRIGLGPGARSNLRKNSRNYSVIFKRYFGPFTRKELVIGEANLKRMHRFAKALVLHGENGRRVLEKSSVVYYQNRKIAAKAMFQVLNKLSDDRAYQPPKFLWKKLQEEQRSFVYDLELILNFPRCTSKTPSILEIGLSECCNQSAVRFKVCGRRKPWKNHN